MNMRIPPIDLEAGSADAGEGQAPAPDAANQGYPDLCFEEPKKDSYRVRLITPMYGGGREPGKPDSEHPIRATEILYGLRFWWRLRQLKQLRDADTPQGEIYQRLFERERGLWGAPADRDQAWPCRVRLRIDLISEEEGGGPFKAAPCVTFDRPRETRDGRGRTKWNWKPHEIGPRYAIFPGINKTPGPPNARKEPTWQQETDKPRMVISPGLEFRMSVRCEIEERTNEVKEALRAWICFGGLGARTRRGLGALEASKISDAPADNEQLNWLEPFSPDDMFDNFGCVLIEKAPVESSQETWEIASKKAWEIAVNTLADFCQHNTLLARNGSRKGRSFWPEADSIRTIVHHHFDNRADPEARDKRCHIPRTGLLAFPRAAFGLPRNFRFAPKQGAGESWTSYSSHDPKPTSLVPCTNRETLDRLASPLILKPMRTKEGNYAPIALLLPTDHLMNLGMEVRKGSGKVTKYDQILPTKLAPPNTSSSAAPWWPVEWIEQKKRAELNGSEFPAKAMTRSPSAKQAAQPYRGNDESILLPLAAFLDYFQNPGSFK